MGKFIQIDIIDVGNESFVETTQGGYNKLEVAYKDDGKVGGKKLVDFSNKELYKTVKSFKKGDKVEVNLEKEAGSDGREYWQWKAVRKLGAEEGALSGTGVESGTKAMGPAVQGTSGRPAGKVVGSNYETPEERALRQVLIVRQSSLEQANKFLTATSNGADYTLSDLKTVALDLANFVFDDGVLLPPALIPQVVKTERQEQAAKAIAPKRGRPAKAAETKAGTAVDDEDIPF